MRSPQEYRSLLTRHTFTIRRQVYSAINYCQDFINHPQKQLLRFCVVISKYFLSWKERLSSSRMRGGNTTERGGREKRGFKSEREIGALSPINQQTSLPSQDGVAYRTHGACARLGQRQDSRSPRGSRQGRGQGSATSGERSGQLQPLTELLTLSRGHR